MLCPSHPESENSSRQGIGLGLFLFAAVFLCYQPVWHAGFIWDDAAHLTQPEFRSLHGLWRIWFEPGAKQQYYPLVHSAFWVEDKVWGESGAGHHLVNLFFHGLVAVLLLKLLRDLEIPGAWLAATIFALHPIQVETAAWVTELKNTLSGALCLGAAIFYLRFDHTRNKAAFGVSLALFVVGLMAKTVIATLPAALLVIFWWKRNRLSWKTDVVPLLPFFGVGALAGLFTAWMERHVIGAEGSGYNLTFLNRILVSGRAVWFYLSKIFWPVNLMFSYPRWKVRADAIWQYVFPLGVILLLAILWILRKRTRGPLAAMLIFVGTLFPAIGFLNVFPFRYSFVADHFQYLACIGPIVLVSAGIEWILSRAPSPPCLRRLAVLGIFTVMLGTLTWHQCQIYQDQETLWRATIASNPTSWLAENDLGAILFHKGRVDEAIALYHRSLTNNPANAETCNNLGAALESKGQTNQAISQYEKAVELRPNFGEAHRNLGDLLLRTGQLNDALAHLQRAVLLCPDLAKNHFTLAQALLRIGRTGDALGEFQEALTLRPDDAPGHYDFGVLLLQQGYRKEAIAEFEKSLVLDPRNADAENNLGYSLLREGRVDLAADHLRKAVELRPNYPQARFNLGNVYTEQNRFPDAIQQFQAASQMDPKSPDCRMRLADVYAGAQEFDQAAASEREALQLALEQKKSSLAEKIQARLRIYEAHRKN